MTVTPTGMFHRKVPLLARSNALRSNRIDSTVIYVGDGVNVWVNSAYMNHFRNYLYCTSTS